MSGEKGIRVRVALNPVAGPIGSLDLYIVDEHDPHRPLLAKPMTLEFAPLGTINEVPSPSLRLFHPIAGEFLRAMAEAASGAGQKPDAQSRVEGVLAAQERHLEDLRTLLNLGTGPSSIIVEVKR